MRYAKSPDAAACIAHEDFVNVIFISSSADGETWTGRRKLLVVDDAASFMKREDQISDFALRAAASHGKQNKKNGATNTASI